MKIHSEHSDQMFILGEMGFQVALAVLQHKTDNVLLMKLITTLKLMANVYGYIAMMNANSKLN